MFFIRFLVIDVVVKAVVIGDRFSSLFRRITLRKSFYFFLR